MSVVMCVSPPDLFATKEAMAFTDSQMLLDIFHPRVVFLFYSSF
jgi:hypothetical protein